jgi:O-antigen/teichoic acid export membrane protein
MFFMGVLYSRVLGADGVGQLGLFDKVKLIGGTLAVTGVGPASIYFINNLKYPIARVVTVNLYFAILSGLVTTAGIFGLVTFMPWYFGKVHSPVAALFALSVGVTPMFSVLHQVLFAELATTKIIVSQLIGTTVMIVAGAVLAVMHYLTVQNAILAGVAGSLVSTAVVAVYQRRYVDFSIRFDWGLFRKIWGYGLKLASFGVLLLVVMGLSVLLLGYLMPKQFGPVGLYIRAETICGLAAMLPRLTAPLFYAKWSGVEGESLARQVEIALRMNVMYSLVVTAILLVAGEYIIWLMYGKAFRPAAPALRILAVGTVFASIFWISHNAIIGAGRGGLMSWIIIGTLLVMFPTIYFLVPRIGIMGAAVGTVCGNVVMGAATLVACRKLFGVRIGHCILATPDDARQVLRSLRGGSATATVAALATQEPEGIQL